MSKEVVVVVCPDVLKKPHFYEAIKARNYDIAVVADKYEGDKADYVLNVDYRLKLPTPHGVLNLEKSIL